MFCRPIYVFRTFFFNFTKFRNHHPIFQINTKLHKSAIIRHLPLISHSTCFCVIFCRMSERVCFCFDSTTKMNELIESFFFSLGRVSVFWFVFFKQKEKNGFPQWPFSLCSWWAHDLKKQNLIILIKKEIVPKLFQKVSCRLQNCQQQQNYNTFCAL
jgi:hypothetical protein